MKVKTPAKSQNRLGTRTLPRAKPPRFVAIASAIEYGRQKHWRLVEHITTKGGTRLNFTTPAGKSRTLRVGGNVQV